MADDLVLMRPDCSQCGGRMMLSRIVPYPIEAPTHEQHTFECRACGHSDNYVMEFQRRAPKDTSAEPHVISPYRAKHP